MDGTKRKGSLRIHELHLAIILTCTKAITRPFDYVISLPGKNFRKQVLAAFNVWLQLDERSLNIIDRVVGMLHNASLM